MDALINRVFSFFRRYRKLSKMIDHKVKVSSSVKSVLGGMFLASIIVLLPTLVVINMFIYTKLTLFLSLLLLVVAIIWVLLYFRLYYKLLKYYNPEVKDINTNVPAWVEGIGVSIFILTFGIIVIATVL